MSAHPTLDTLSVIHQRKSVRHFTGAPVPPETLETLLRAGMAAPSAVNTQPWEFLTVTDRSLLIRLGDELPYAKMLYAAGAAIVVCGRPELAHHRMPEFAVLDAALAAQNILLAAEAVGLGAVWTAAYPYPDRMATVREVLAIPEHVIPLCVIPVGHPTGEDQPKNKWRPEKIHRERW
jgi:nitroreductase